MDASLKVIKFGKKAVYLPKFTVTLLRTPKLSPYHARFKVPLDFSKFDLRDYLFHAYNVRTTNIRSYVKYNAVRQSESSSENWRPDPDKYMTVEMDKPFVWPAEPKDKKPWEGENNKLEAEDMQNNTKPSMEKRKKDIRILEEQAGELARKGLQAWEKERTPKYISAEEPKYKIKV